MIPVSPLCEISGGQFPPNTSLVLDRIIQTLCGKNDRVVIRKIIFFYNTIIYDERVFDGRYGRKRCCGLWAKNNYTIVLCLHAYVYTYTVYNTCNSFYNEKFTLLLLLLLLLFQSGMVETNLSRCSNLNERAKRGENLS